MLEFYQAYATYDDLMDFTEAMLRGVDARARRGDARGARAVEGGAPVHARRAVRARPDGPRRRGRRPSRRRSPSGSRPSRTAAARASSRCSRGDFGEQHQGVGEVVAAREGDRLGQLPQGPREVRQRRRAPLRLLRVPRRAVPRRRTTAPTTASARVPVFVKDYPFEISPLARRNDARPELVDRFELFVHGRELCNAFSELNDPDDQAERFRDQVAKKAARRRGDDGLRRGLHPRARARHAAGGGLRHGHRSPRDDADRRAVDPRRHPLPAPAARGGYPRRCVTRPVIIVAVARRGTASPSCLPRAAAPRHDSRRRRAGARDPPGLVGALIGRDVRRLHLLDARSSRRSAGRTWSAARRDRARRRVVLTGDRSSSWARSSRCLPWILDRLESGARSRPSSPRATCARRRAAFSRVISVLSICGVALSSCALSSVVSVMGGFSQDLKRKILGNNAHIVIDTTSQAAWGDYDAVLDARPRACHGVVGATPVVHGEVMVSSASNLAGVIVRGVDPETHRRRHRPAQEHRGRQGRVQLAYLRPGAAAPPPARRGHRHRPRRRAVHEGPRSAAARRRPRSRGAPRSSPSRRSGPGSSSGASSRRRSTSTSATR